MGSTSVGFVWRQGEEMNIEQLKDFLAIEEYGNFLEASENLYMSQSSLSKQLKALEEELGCLLFDRSTRKVKITKAGEIFSVYAHRMLRDYAAMQKDLKPYSGKENHVFKIAAPPILGQYGIYSILQEYLLKNPEWDISIEELDTPVILEKLEHGKIDFAFLRDIQKFGPNYRSFTICSDELVLIVPENHPLAKRQEINLKDASQEYFYFFGAQSGLYQLCIDACQEAGFYPLIQSGLSRYTIKSLVEKGMGVSLMMKKIAEDLAGNGIKLCQLSSHKRIDIVMIVREEKYSKKVEKLISYFKENM